MSDELISRSGTLSEMILQERPSNDALYMMMMRAALIGFAWRGGPVMLHIDFISKFRGHRTMSTRNTMA